MINIKTQSTTTIPTWVMDENKNICQAEINIYDPKITKDGKEILWDMVIKNSPNEVKLITNTSDNNKSLFVNGEKYFSGRDIPYHVWLNLIKTLSSYNFVHLIVADAYDD